MIKKSFKKLISLDNLYLSWQRFRRGKRERPDVIAFERNLEDELFSLADDLAADCYVHGPYKKFYIHDPKERVVHKATVRDRVVHQAIFDALYRHFDRRFFFDSYSSREMKGTHAAIARVSKFLRSLSDNGRRKAMVLHGDIDDFFASVDHEILFNQLRRAIECPRYLNLCEKIIKSFEARPGKGMPLGNLTSQLFANVYLHEFDYFAKQILRVKPYVRYNDDFFIVSREHDYLKATAEKCQKFFADKLRLSLPENKIKIVRLENGIDILGAVAFPYGSVPRVRLRKAVLRCAREAEVGGYRTDNWRQIVSYLGLLSHTKSFLLQEKLRWSFYEKTQLYARKTI